MCKRTVIALLTPVLALLPGGAAADYLYSAFRDVTYDPYVMFILDNSGSMRNAPDSTGSGASLVCPYGKTGSTCNDRAYAAREVLAELVSNLDGVEMGLIHFNTQTASGDENGCNISSGSTSSCGRTRVAVPGSGDIRATILANLPPLSQFNTNTPIALSLWEAGEVLKEVAKNDTAVACRDYYVILLSDGEDNCCRDPIVETTALRSLSLGGGKTLDVRTFVIGFGKDVANNAALSQMARRGGTARRNDQWECWDPTGNRQGVPSTCTAGSAIFAGDTASLKAAIEEVLAAIRTGYFAGVSSVIGNVPQTRSEVDRVAQNLMAYTAFDMPDYKGHVFGVRLFTEHSPGNGVWEFTDFTKLDLTKCGSAGNPCAFDGGQRLHDRVRTPGAKARRIWTSELFSVDYQDANGGATSSASQGILLRPKATPLELTNNATGAAALKKAADVLFGKEPFKTLWDGRNASGGLASVATAHPDRIGALFEDPSTRRQNILSWLHGVPSARAWPLGDAYHGGATIVEPPPSSYRTRGYPVFRETLRNRASMVYVPTNDGMIHAFHAGPDLVALREKKRETAVCDNQEAWCAGDEAWAYLPVNMLAKSAVEILGGSARFFSMDLSCRVDDVLVHDNSVAGGNGFDCNKDPEDPKLCGWRTVLLCGQGWGGHWYVALDVSKPLEPRALWELTFDDGAKGFGRTWSVPGIALIVRDDLPRWVAFTGNGYNTDLKPKGGSSHRAYRLLNLPFTGDFAHHGDGTKGDDDHVYAFDVANGRIIRSFDTSLDAVVADITVVDVDRDGFDEAVYVAGWSGEIHRIGLGGGGVREADSPSSWGYCDKLFKFGGNNPVPNRPAVLADPAKANRLYLIAASGVDKGSFPDDATNLNASYDLDGWYIDDDGGTKCNAVSSPKGSVSGNGNMCKDNSGVKINGLFTGNASKRRLMGAPIIASQTNGDRWLTFTAWNPPTNACGGDGESALYCLKWNTDPAACDYCRDLNGDGKTDGSDESIVISNEITTQPVSADGEIYVSTEKGTQRVNNQSGTSGPPDDPPRPGNDGTGANLSAPRNVVISWREVFETL